MIASPFATARAPAAAARAVPAAVAARLARRASALLAVALLAAPAARAAGAAGATDPQAVWHHDADCVAALKLDLEARLPEGRAGKPGVRAELLHLTQWGFAIIGTAYKQGLRKPEADPMLDAAEARLRKMPAEQLKPLQLECRQEGQQMFDAASGLEQWLLTNRANARLDKLLARKAAASAGS